MTFTTSAWREIEDRVSTVTVALCGRTLPPPSALRSGVISRPSTHTTDWRFLPKDMISAPTQVDIALCDSPQAAGTAHAQWPAATVICLIPAYDDGSATLAALHAGAEVCVRGDDATLISAYLHSVARRRGLIMDGHAR